MGCPDESGTEVRVRDLWREVKDEEDWWGDLKEESLRVVRRRTRPMSCFQNGASVDRIIYGVISHLNQAWEERPLKEFTHFS